MKTITIIVETPKGSAEKYDYDKQLQCFKMNKVMPAGMVFPFDFGFIPGTKGQDGDPLDIIVISEIKTFTGCALDCRIIGAIAAAQTERDGKTVRNDRYLGIPVESTLFAEIVTVNDLPKKILKQLEDFFINYNTAAGKKFKVLGHKDASTAVKMISATAPGHTGKTKPRK